MSTTPVHFTYRPGLNRAIFNNARLQISCDADGHYSDSWRTIPMQGFKSEDGCPSYEATIDIDETEVGRQFHWGVVVDGPRGDDVWGIPSEVNDHLSNAQYRDFALLANGGARPQEEDYYLTHCRRLGAQKVYRPGQNRPAIRFSVWAPNAQKVEVLIATFWKSDDTQHTPREDPLPVGEIGGAYIADDGTGMHPALGPYAMMRQSDGIWTTDINDPELSDFTRFDHKPYMFRITKDNGNVAYRTDLYSRCQIGRGKINPHGSPYYARIDALDGSISCSAVVDPDKITEYSREPVWPEENWLTPSEFWANEFNPAKPVPRRVEDLVIYELHVGALGFGTSSPGTLQDAIELLDYLEELGVNAIELLPMSEFSGNENWGYATSHYFTIEYSQGGRDQYKFFIRECHRRGIAVILDVVYNHFIHQAERAEWLYDSDTPENNIYYWYEGKPSDYPDYERVAANSNNPNAPAPGHGGYLDNVSTAYAPRYHEEMVRKMFISSAAAFVDEFHLDGFRVDQTTSIHAYNVRHADGRPVANANIFGAKMLREWTRTLRLIKPDIMLIAEDHSEWDKVTQPTERGGLGFDATWYANFYHHLIGDTDKGPDFAKIIKTAGLGDEQPLAMDYFASALAASGTNRIVYNESHDEAGNGKLTHRTILVAVNEARLQGDTRRYAEARCRFAFGMTALSAGTPMFLFGEEIGATKDFIYNRIIGSREDLRMERDTTGRRLFSFYHDLIKMRLGSAALRGHIIDIIHVHNTNRVIAFRRWNNTEEYLVLASLNNYPFIDGYAIEHANLKDAQWQEVFNSDAREYGGDDIGNMGATLASSGHRFNVVIPANGFVVFKEQS